MEGIPSHFLETRMAMKQYNHVPTTQAEADWSKWRDRCYLASKYRHPFNILALLSSRQRCIQEHGQTL